MSPKNKKKLNIQRRKLDILDNKLLNVIKLKVKKYNPATRKHEFFVEKKLPPHSK